jgi:hypothetical protein
MYIGDEAFDDCDALMLSVAEGSYAAQYAEENGIPYILNAEEPAFDGPYAINAESGEAVYLGMSKDEAEAIAGEPVGAGFVPQMLIYEGVTLGYRDEAVAYIQIDDDKWTANGAASPGMPIKQAVELLGMSLIEGSAPHSLAYYADGTKLQLTPELSSDFNRDYQWMLTIYGSDTAGMIAMGDKQFLLTYK